MVQHTSSRFIERSCFALVGAWLQQQGLAVEEVSSQAPAMNDGCGAGELSPGQSWSWSEIASSGHLLIQSLVSQGVGTSSVLLWMVMVTAVSSFEKLTMASKWSMVMIWLMPSCVLVLNRGRLLRASNRILNCFRMLNFNRICKALRLLLVIVAIHALAPYLHTSQQQPLLFGIEDSGHIVLPSPHPHHENEWSLVGDGAMTLLLSLLAFQHVDAT